MVEAERMNGVQIIVVKITPSVVVIINVIGSGQGSSGPKSNTWSYPLGGQSVSAGFLLVHS